MHILPGADSLDVKTGKTPDSVIKFGCDVKIRSIHAKELSRICVGSFIICCIPNCDVIFSKILP